MTIRLLDPPLHEFLPGVEEVAQQVERARIERSADLEELERTLERVHSLQETNPMLGTRGCRLGILHPEIYEMQVKAIVRAARPWPSASGAPPLLEIMIPLVAYEKELELDARARGARGRGGGRARPRGQRRHDDRAAARVLRGRPDRRARPTSSRSARTT